MHLQVQLTIQLKSQLSQLTCIPISTESAYLYSDLLGVEVSMRPLVGVVRALELGDWSSRADSDVIRVKVCVNHQSTVEHETRVVTR